MWWTEQSLPPAQSFYLSTINMNADKQINTYAAQKKEGLPVWTQKLIKPSI